MNNVANTIELTAQIWLDTNNCSIFENLYNMLYKYFKKVVYHLNIHISYDDVYHNAIIKFLDNKDKYDSNKGKFLSYFNKIFINECYRFINDVEIDCDNIDIFYKYINMYDGEYDYDKDKDIDNKLNNIYSILSNMEDNYYNNRMKTAFVLKYIDGKRFKDIMKIMDCSENTAKKYTMDCKKFIREKI